MTLQVFHSKGGTMKIFFRNSECGQVQKVAKSFELVLKLSSHATNLAAFN